MKVGCAGQAPDANGQYNTAFNLLERRRCALIGLRGGEYKQRDPVGCNRFVFFGFLGGNELRRRRGEVLSWHMTIPTMRREAVEYRGYSLQVIYAAPQWQVLIGTIVEDRPMLPSEKQIVRGWDEGETLKRAKMRIDLLIESPSLN